MRIVLTPTNGCATSVCTARHKNKGAPAIKPTRPLVATVGSGAYSSRVLAAMSFSVTAFTASSVASPRTVSR